MTYQQFEDIPVWQAGIDLSVQVFELTDNPLFRSKGDIANQIQRAALSVPNNIAEGFERGSTAELINFLYYARGSAGEVRSICHVMLRLRALGDYKSQIAEIKEQAISVSRQLGGWLKSLKESDLPGQRYFSESDRRRQEQKKRADAFMAKLKEQTEAKIRKSRES
jgi:four helix bundle protein